MSELWGVVCYSSGTMNVQNTTAGNEPFAYGKRSLEPWLYIFGPHSADEATRDRDRRKCCEDITVFLNGGARPAWLSDMERITEDSLVSLDGTRIYATGPMIDANPPACQWSPDESQEATDARARLIDRLAMVSPVNAESPWMRPNEHGELSGGICCQRATGTFCFEHDPKNWTTINGRWVNRTND